MKTEHLALLTGILLLATLQGEPSNADLPVYLPPPAAVSVETRIPHALEVPAFTPPAPVVPKQVPAMRVDAAVSMPTRSGRTLTVIRAEASALPEIPDPVVQAARPPRPLTPEEVARHAEERRRRLQFSAVVHENGVSVIRWQHPDTEEAYEAICGFDVNLLAGVGLFTSDGKIYQLTFTPPGVMPLSRKRSGKFSVPPPPEAAPDSISIIQGDATDPVGTATATLLRDLIANEASRLVPYQAARRQHQAAAAKWSAAHPMLPRDETIWLKPHRGSRYLAAPNPEEGTAR